MRAPVGLAAALLLNGLIVGLAQPAWWDPTAEPIWRNPEPTIGTPAVDHEAVYALTADHELLKVSLEDGSQRWRTHTGERGTTYGHRMRLAEELVLVGEYDVAAFDRTTGRRRWVFTPAEGHAPGPYLGEVVDGVAYAGSASGHLHALDTRSGRPRWSSAIETREEATVYWPSVRAGQVLAGFTVHAAPPRGGVVAVDQADGRVCWRFDFPARPVSMQMAGGVVSWGDWVAVTSGSGEVWLLDQRTGTLRGTLPALTGPLDSIIPANAQDYRALAVSDDILIVGSTTGYVTAYGRTERQELWRYPGGRLGSTAFTVSATRGLAIVPYVSGFLVALDAATGQLRWRTNDWTQGFLWPPAVSGSMAVAASSSGLWALDAFKEAQ